MDNPTNPETAEQNTGRADVSYGANSNLSSSDVAETAAAQQVEEAHQRSGSQSGAGFEETSDPDQQMDNSGMLSPQGQQPAEGAGTTRMGQTGEDRNRES
ncbi:hypothetical protein FNU79_13595 [Deinococcus detaillensis]|uniref:Uncharacterized protein n=1 Tax=Deinococcus detaillensis TaxID=2592048 RepID=A0A553UQU6_9DEIO|nr:hypothetical protein [Deinococcus detaillensis]TSA82594.1 hypothetical protein FNU79_13595 [Deinococcus detaillensis]